MNLIEKLNMEQDCIPEISQHALHWGGCLVPGGECLVPGGGCLLPGEGVCLLWGVSAPGGSCLWSGGYPSMQWGRPLHVEKYEILL